MPRGRRTRPQNMGQNRNVQMRNNARRGGRTFSPNQNFQGGVGQNAGVSPQRPGQPSAQNRQQCPPGQMPGKDPNTGAQTCVPAANQQRFGQGQQRTGAGIPGADRNKPGANRNKPPRGY